jgi:hypothetical protein
MTGDPFRYRDHAEVHVQAAHSRQTLRSRLVFFAPIPFFELIEEGQVSHTIPVVLLWP